MREGAQAEQLLQRIRVVEVRLHNRHAHAVQHLGAGALQRHRVVVVEVVPAWGQEGTVGEVKDDGGGLRVREAVRSSLGKGKMAREQKRDRWRRDCCASGKELDAMRLLYLGCL